MDYIIGMDGGGTSTILRVTDLTGAELSFVSGGASNVYANTKEQVTDTLKDLIARGVQEAGVQDGRCAALCLGVAGISNSNADTWLPGTLSALTGCEEDKIVLVGDFATALAGGTDNAPGLAVIAGTGSVCFGRGPDGRFERAGGWGHIIGDEGSAYHMAVTALNLTMKVFDGRSDNKILARLICEKLGATAPRDIVDYVNPAKFNKTEIARLAPLVDAAADAGDMDALTILDCSADALVDLCVAVAEKLSLEGKFVIATTGGVINKDPYVRPRFIERIKKHFPLAHITFPLKDSAWGAVYLAQEKLK